MHQVQVSQLTLYLDEGAELQWLLTALGNVHWSRQVDAASSIPGSAWSIFCPGSRTGGAPAEKGQQNRCPQLCHVLQPPSKQELMSLQGLLARSSCCPAVSGRSQCWLCLCYCLRIFSRSKTETRQDEEARGIPAQGLM